MTVYEWMFETWWPWFFIGMAVVIGIVDTLIERGNKLRAEQERRIADRRERRARR
jgi:hypothetical protein